MMPDLGSLPLGANVAVFAVAAAVIWWAGTRLEGLADTIAMRTGLGRAFTGMLLLAGTTSLPELATTVSAVAVLNNPTLATHNLLGGVALQTAILVAADLAQRDRGALTYFSPRFVLLLEGVGLILLLQVTIAGLIAGGRPSLFSVSLWTVMIMLIYVALMFFIYRYRGMPRWTPTHTDDVPSEKRAAAAGTARARDRRPLPALWLSFSGFAVLVLAGGLAATHSAEILADRTGLGDAFLGATLLALVTSLPELSTTIAAARNGRYTVAISNIFGSNAFDVSLLFLAELLYRRGTILAHAGPTVVFVAAIGAAMTCIYLWGLIERENRTVLRIGWDSVAALLLYLVGVSVLYVLR